MKTLAGKSRTTATMTSAPPAPDPVLSDPTLAAALFHAWAGDPLTLVSSPPGAGKTFLVTNLAARLAGRANLRVAIAGQTRAQCIDLASRIATLGAPVAFLDGKANKDHRPLGLHPAVAFLPGTPAQQHQIVVATTERWLRSGAGHHRADILLVDEAFQMDYASMGALGAIAPQFMMVGDPGQIDPVITADTTRWEHSPTGPHRPAPDALIATYGEDVIQLALPHTRRLGPHTTALIAPTFYPDLPFTSIRLPIHLSGPTGPLPELAHVTINSASGHDPMIADAAAAAVRHLLTCTVTDAGGTRAMTPADIAVVTPHVHHAAQTSARLSDLGPDVLIGTANALQGSERTACVVIHPLIGAPEVSPFALDPGRTCVALSRHRAHATVITDTKTPALLDAAAAHSPENLTITQHQQVLAHLATC